MNGVISELTRITTIDSGERHRRREGVPEFRRGPSPSTAAEPSSCNPAGSSPDSAAGNTAGADRPNFGDLDLDLDGKSQVRIGGRG